ncbi:hypothetical protein [Kibale red colobus virus 1]|uniref:Uncharacterized protein n=1 Tax=Kibale red colobus virus 1 TaxID=1885929 RepID=X2D6S4_9NIDO|nr:hypothetical protein [Kibale red colobus virus 1]AHH53861.1 hypothetical protein [Kibale red colobus virus 1]
MLAQIGAFLDSFAINLIYVFLCVVAVYSAWSIMDFHRRRKRQFRHCISQSVDILGTTPTADHQSQLRG